MRRQPDRDEKVRRAAAGHLYGVVGFPREEEDDALNLLSRGCLLRDERPRVGAVQPPLPHVKLGREICPQVEARRKRASVGRRQPASAANLFNSNRISAGV